MGLTKNSRINNKIINEHGEQIKCFKRALYQFSYTYTGCQAGEFLNAYLNKTVMPVNVLSSPHINNEPILLCLVKDDLEKIKPQVEYHRKIGIKHFAYIDNVSTDGTLEWLKDQDDVSLFTVNDTYNSVKQSAWRRQVTDILGYDRWYLILDSDELFMYPGIEKNDIHKFIGFLEANDIKSAFSPMIDMYSNRKLFEENDNSKDIFNTYCYFDVDYKKGKRYSRFTIDGGPRARLFSTKDNYFSCTLEKYALIKLSQGMMAGTHQNYPYKYNLETNGAIAFLLHYKFLPKDYEKYNEFIISGIYSLGSREYKRYMEMYKQNQNLSFYYNGSQKLNSSMDLLKTNIVDKKFFRKFLGIDL